MVFIFSTVREKFFSGRAVSMDWHVKTGLSFYRLWDWGSEPSLVPLQSNSRRGTRTHISWFLAQSCLHNSICNPAMQLHFPRIETISLWWVLWNSSNQRCDLAINYLRKSSSPGFPTSSIHRVAGNSLFAVIVPFVMGEVHCFGRWPRLSPSPQLTSVWMHLHPAVPITLPSARGSYRFWNVRHSGVFSQSWQGLGNSLSDTPISIPPSFLISNGQEEKHNSGNIFYHWLDDWIQHSQPNLEKRRQRLRERESCRSHLFQHPTQGRSPKMQGVAWILEFGSRAGSPRSRQQLIACPVRTHFLVQRWLSSVRPLAWHKRREISPEPPL